MRSNAGGQGVEGKVFKESEIALMRYFRTALFKQPEKAFFFHFQVLLDDFCQKLDSDFFVERDNSGSPIGMLKKQVRAFLADFLESKPVQCLDYFSCFD